MRIDTASKTCGYDVAQRVMLDIIAGMHWTLWVLFSLLVPSLALAQPGEAAVTESRDAEARGLFDAGAAAFADARYDEALAHFEGSYRLSQRPELLYNLAVSCERLGRDAEALDYLRRYLAEVPDAENRRDVEGRITMIERRVAATTTTPAPSSGVDPAGLALAISGGVVAIGGAVLVAVAAADQSSIEGSPMGTPWSSVADAADRVPVLSGVGWAAIGVGAAVAVTGVVLLATSTSGSESEARVRLAPFGLIAEGTF